MKKRVLIAGFIGFALGASALFLRSGIESWQIHERYFYVYITSCLNKLNKAQVPTDFENAESLLSEAQSLAALKFAVENAYTFLVVPSLLFGFIAAISNGKIAEKEESETRTRSKKVQPV